VHHPPGRALALPRLAEPHLAPPGTASPCPALSLRFRPAGRHTTRSCVVPLGGAMPVPARRCQAQPFQAARCVAAPKHAEPNSLPGSAAPCLAMASVATPCHAAELPFGGAAHGQAVDHSSERSPALLSPAGAGQAQPGVAGLSLSSQPPNPSGGTTHGHAARHPSIWSPASPDIARHSPTLPCPARPGLAMTDLTEQAVQRREAAAPPSRLGVPAQPGLATPRRGQASDAGPSPDVA